MKKPKISVYIPSRNYGKYLQEAIESVLRQTVDSWELLLIDVGSSDNTRDLMALYKSDPRVRVFTTEDTQLPQVANFALKQSRGDYIIRLDADDVFDANILLVLSNYLDRYPDVALVFPDYFLVDDHGGIIHYEGRQTIYHSNHLLNMPANGACTMVRKKVLKNIGGYREDLGAQDGFDLWTKVLEKQHKCANVNVPLFYYRRHGKNLTTDQTRILSAKRTIKKDASSINLDKYRPIIAVIPCREHYDIYPDLWSKKLNKKPLLDIAVETCIASKIFDKIIVTSDTADVQDNMVQYKDKRLQFIERSRESTIYSSSVVHTLEYINKILKNKWKGLTVLSYIQAPFTSTQNLEEAVYTLIYNNADSAFSVEEFGEDVYRRTPHGLTPLNPQGRVKSDFDKIYASARTSVATRNINIRTGTLTGAKMAYFVIPKEEAFFINTKRDFEIANILKKSSPKEILV
ncbi:glycosyltransferase family 2 protein [Candidatus Omnitrophota bacterium]